MRFNKQEIILCAQWAGVGYCFFAVLCSVIPAKALKVPGLKVRTGSNA